MKRLYFDTNVYRFVSAKGEIERVAELISSHHAVLTASSGNLFETYAIADAEERKQELSALVVLADSFESHPESWRHAVELRHEIKRLRPKWLRQVVSKRESRDFLRAHRARWAEAIAGVPVDPDAYGVYKRDSEEGVSGVRRAQKQQREELNNESSQFTLVSPNGDIDDVKLGDPEVYWRLDCLQAWYGAIEKHNPASRDYADWLGPYLRPGSFRDPSYRSFWLQEVKGEALPLNRLTGLVWFYQLKKKITHGNAADQLHASHWFKSDLFVTADRTFHEILTDIAVRHYPGRPSPALVDRSASSAADQIENLLELPG